MLQNEYSVYSRYANLYKKYIEGMPTCKIQGVYLVNDYVYLVIY